MGTSKENPLDDRSDKRLTPKLAWKHTEQDDILGRHVAEAYDVSEGYVSQQKGDYKQALNEGKEKGKEEVSPEDFEAEELREALGDDEPDHNPYNHTCPICDSLIESPDSAGKHPCPECGETIQWDESEL